MLDGGVGCDSGGSFERSRVRPGDRLLDAEEEREERVEGTVILSDDSIVGGVCVYRRRGS